MMILSCVGFFERVGGEVMPFLVFHGGCFGMLGRKHGGVPLAQLALDPLEGLLLTVGFFCQINVEVIHLHLRD